MGPSLGSLGDTLVGFPPIVILAFGLCAGATVGYLVGRIVRAQVHRQLRKANTVLRSLELDRDRLQGEVKTAQDEVARLLAVPPPSNNEDRELVVILNDNSSNLTRIKGIGPKIAAILMAEGVETTEDLAGLTDADIRDLAERWPGMVSRMRRERWRELAAAENDASALQDVQANQEPNHAGRGTPEDVPVEVEEPDAVVAPEVEYPPVRFG